MASSLVSNSLQLPGRFRPGVKSILLILVALIVGLNIQFHFSPTTSFPGLNVAHPATTYASSLSSPRRHIAIASHVHYHHNVYMVVCGSFQQQVLPAGGSVQVYALPFNYEWQDINEQMGLYQGTLAPPQQLMTDLKRNNLFENDPGAYIDLVVLGTCELDLPKWSEELLKIWDSRPADQKFMIVCTVHHTPSREWRDWSVRRSIRLIAISEQVVKELEDVLAERNDSADPEEYTSLLEYVKADTYYPILDLPDASFRDVARPPRGLVHAMIQGNFDLARRDYTGIYQDLTKSLMDEPKAWGYLPLSTSRNSSFTKDPHAQLEAFQLHLIGAGNFVVPEVLQNVIQVHKGVDYPDFFKLVQSMDIIVPAFNNKGKYFGNRASSTVHTAITANAPLLCTKRLINTYQYMDDDGVVILRPQSVREIEALKALRTGSISHLSDRVASSPEFAADVNDMMRRGWWRSNKDFRKAKERLWKKNEQLVWRLLRDM